MTRRDAEKDRPANENSPRLTAEDFVLQQHNSAESLSHEEIARRYARQYHGRAEPSYEDLQFVASQLANREG
jgi:hypothetical protein